jgi:hypothetical protein
MKNEPNDSLNRGLAGIAVVALMTVLAGVLASWVLTIVVFLAGLVIGVAIFPPRYWRGGGPGTTDERD